MMKMNQDDELSLDFVESLLAQPQTRGRKHKSEKQELEEDRNINVWFKYAKGIDSSGELRNCEVPNHDESTRPRNKGLTVLINDVAVCRVCFLAGLDRG
jgi:hypothetical protein